MRRVKHLLDRGGLALLASVLVCGVTLTIGALAGDRPQQVSAAPPPPPGVALAPSGCPPDPAATATPTSTPTDTPTATFVAPTATPTDTPTATFVAPTATPTDTPTATFVAPTATPTDTPTATFVAPTATPTDTPTATFVAPTATPTDTPTAGAGFSSQGVSAQAVGEPVDCSPVAVADAYSVVGGATLSPAAPGILANDSDPNGDPLSAQLVSTTTRGTLALNPNGSFTYTPGENTVGTDSFTYQACDATECSDTVTVTITVQVGCDGRRATQVGTAGNDELGGSGGNDVIVGLGGNDVIEPGSGTDIVCGGSGRDNVRAGSGNDTVFGGSGDDTLDGGSGNDRLFGEAGIDRLFGGGDNDALDGGADTPDRCDGEGGSDTATTSCETIISATTGPPF